MRSDFQRAMKRLERKQRVAYRLDQIFTNLMAIVVGVVCALFLGGFVASVRADNVPVELNRIRIILADIFGFIGGYSFTTWLVHKD